MQTTMVIVPDLLFFGTVALFVRCLYIIKPCSFSARFALVIAAWAALWSVLNTGWLISSDVQLQPGILTLLLSDFKDIWPLARSHVLHGLKHIVLLGVIVLVALGILLRCFLRPAKVVASRRHHTKWALSLLVSIFGVLGIGYYDRVNIGSSFAGEVLGFSSHWYALAYIFTGQHKASYPLEHSSNIYHRGERRITPPNVPSHELPNVLVILLEGTSHVVTSLSDAENQTTPCLAGIAGDGVEFRTTRVPVPYTSKAYWATLTATSPVIMTDEVEAIPAEQPYESLATILGGAGYRTAFFEMSKGNFECAPGFFSNMGFDFAWFRENLEDPSAYIGYLGGDDCRMIEPAFKWVKEAEGPFFLMMITSVAHDPFEVPSWFAEPKQDPYEKYLQTVRYTDYFIEKVCGELAANGLEDNTIVCILGDHGTSFRTNQARGRWIPYEEVIRIPWVLRWPGHVQPGKVIDWPCSQMDVTPTILKLIGFDISKADFDGRDAMAKPESARRFYFSSLLLNSPLGFVEDSRKVVYWPYIEKVFEYDLQTDPNEENAMRISGDKLQEIKNSVQTWKERSQIAVDAKKHTKRFLFSHWQVFSSGRSAWAYYVPAGSPKLKSEGQ